MCCIMKSRMNRYYDDETPIPSRQAKNMELYREINSTDINDFKLNSNISVIDDNGNNIDIQKIREILDKRYREEPKNKKIANFDNEDYYEMNLDETRDYDINAILEKAKEKKEVNYEIDRLKKIRNTQFDILNSLDIDKKEDEDLAPKEELKEDQARLMELINTITSKELVKSYKDGYDNDAGIDPLDILTDLKGDENTVVVPGLKEVLDDSEKEEIKDEIKEEVVEEIKEELRNECFETNSLAFTESDFDDFNDLKEDVKSNGIFIKVLMFLVILILICGIVFMLNGIFEWGLFLQ